MSRFKNYIKRNFQHFKYPPHIDFREETKAFFKEAWKPFLTGLILAFLALSVGQITPNAGTYRKLVYEFGDPDLWNFLGVFGLGLLFFNALLIAMGFANLSNRFQFHMIVSGVLRFTCRLGLISFGVMLARLLQILFTGEFSNSSISYSKTALIIFILVMYIAAFPFYNMVLWRAGKIQSFGAYDTELEWLIAPIDKRLSIPLIMFFLITCALLLWFPV